jgi:ketosteroid isomerase-like protein
MLFIRRNDTFALALTVVFAGMASVGSSMTAAASDKPAATPPPQQDAAPKSAMTAAECEVWNRERSFAASVANHDATTFADHVQANAAFDAGSATPTHGRDAVVADWKGIIEGKQIKLGWSPGIVTIGGDGNLAISRGPSWIEDLRPNPKQHYRIGEFISTWIKDTDGQWRVLFDGGAGPMHAASADDVAKLVESLPKECPRAAP